MMKRRVVSDQERAAAQAIEDAYRAAPPSECRPGIRGRCGNPGCEHCDNPPAADPRTPGNTFK